ncbi:MAG TPA: polysaccharide deacetylase family protein [Gaiellaceae bacterium]|jgi:peptidoglycan/xylan/chitin deacetylase (PgdA/CDA1 family)|nr:polysaccharide deacetylase family protein [Gaiellaceae bacterium]
MIATLVAAAVALPTPAQLPTVARLTQSAQPIYCGGTRGRNFALTFDDGPSPYTAALVRVLRRARARATFFDVGSRVAFWPSAARASTTVGEIGNHTWSHAHLVGLSARETRDELASTQREIQHALGVTPQLFRPPYAEADAADDVLARELGLLDVRWSFDSGDSRLGVTPRSVAHAAITALRPGAIILLHDTHPTTAAVARTVLRAAKRKGLRPLTVSALLARQPPAATQIAAIGGSHCPSR